MKHRFRRLFQFRLRTLFAFLTLAACFSTFGVWFYSDRQKKAIVTGLVLDSGQPIAVRGYYPGENCVFVEFTPRDRKGNVDVRRRSFETGVTEDGYFEIRGDVGDGIPVGRYKIALSLVEASADNTRMDSWQGKFDSQGTPFVYDVETDAEIIIDIAIPELHDRRR
jgi:hypothetical protein